MPCLCQSENGSTPSRDGISCGRNSRHGGTRRRWSPDLARSSCSTQYRRVNSSRTGFVSRFSFMAAHHSFARSQAESERRPAAPVAVTCGGADTILIVVVASDGRARQERFRGEPERAL